MAAQGLTGISSILTQLGLGEAGAATGSAGTIVLYLNQYRQGNLQDYQIHQQALQSMMATIGGAVGLCLD